MDVSDRSERPPLSDEEQVRRRKSIADLMPTTPFISWVGMVIDRYEPDYAHSCEVCGSTPVVSGVKNGKTVYVATMCGPCLWNEPGAGDPATWNEASGA